MAKLRDNKPPPPDDDRRLQQYGDEPTSPDEKLRQRVEREFAGYDATRGAISLARANIENNAVSWIIWKLQQLTGLKTLDISNNSIGEAGAAAIAEHLTGLTALNVGNNEIGEAGAVAIAEHLVGLATLSIWCNSIGDVGAVAIAENLTGLTKLNIANNKISVAGAVAIAENLTGLAKLSIWCNSIGDVGAVAIAENLTGLTKLNIADNKIGDAGAVAIAEHLTGLTTLDLGYNSVGESGAIAIAEHLTGLTTLSVQDNLISEAETIAKLLERLICGGNPLGLLKKIGVSGNRLHWPGKSVPISNNLLLERDPRKLRNLLLSLRESSAELSAGGVAFIGRTLHGKSHAARWIGATEDRFAFLRQPIPLDNRTWGYDRLTTTLKEEQHGLKGVGDLYMTVVDVGGHREQLHSAANLVYMNARRSVFVLVLKAGESFEEGNWGRYYLRLIQALRARKRTAEAGEDRSIYDLAAAGRTEKIPVLLLITHSKNEVLKDLPTAEQLKKNYPLLDVIDMQRWEAPAGDQYLPELHKKLGEQLGKLESLRGQSVRFIIQLMDKIRELFQLDQSATRMPPTTGSISVAEFRRLCADLGGNTAEQQEAAIRELSSFGYLAHAGMNTSYDDDARLLNPKFVNYYLFQKLLEGERGGNQNGYISEERLNQIFSSISKADRLELKELIDRCLITFEWGTPNGGKGIFVPDLLPIHQRDEVAAWPDAQCRVKLKPLGFFSEDSFFRFLGWSKPHLRVSSSAESDDGSCREILLYRNLCVLGDSPHQQRDVCTARIWVDVIAEELEIEVKGPDYAKCKSFGDGLREQLKTFGNCNFDGQWEVGAFEQIMALLKGTEQTAKRAATMIWYMAAKLSDNQLHHAFSEGRLGAWATQNSDEVKFWTDDSCRDKGKRPSEFLASQEIQILSRHDKGGLVLSVNLGVPFIAWLKANRRASELLS